MLTAFANKDFTDQVITLFSPSFVPVDRPWDRVWLTWLWSLGQGWGFEPKYEMYLADYKEVVPTSPSVPSDVVVHRFNALYGDWVKMWYRDSGITWFEFMRTDWEFEEWKCEDARLQRIWVYLYANTFSGGRYREDLLEPLDKPWLRLNIHLDTGWFVETKIHDSKTRQLNRRADIPPHYVCRNKRGRGGRWMGKIKTNTI